MTYEHDIPQYACIRTLEMEIQGGNSRVAGFFVHPSDRDRHNRELQVPCTYRLVYEGDNIRKLEGVEGPDRIQDNDFVFQTFEPLPAVGAAVRNVHLHIPSPDEIRAVCQRAELSALTDGCRKDHLPFDVQGDRLFSADDWNYMTELAETNRMWKGLVNDLRKPITSLVTMADGTELKVDFNLSGPMETILGAGIQPERYDSGTVSDHPNWRIETKDSMGLYAQGEPRASGLGAYMLFKGTDLNGVRVHTDKQLQIVAEQALAAGWRVDPFHPDKDAVLVCLPFTADGSTLSEIVREANRWIKHTALQDNGKPEDREYAVRFEHGFKESIQRHGGRSSWTDDEVIGRWENLAARLSWRCRIEQGHGWLRKKDTDSIRLDPVKDKEMFQRHMKRMDAVADMCQVTEEQLEWLGNDVLDKLARRNGFDGFETNLKGTGLRDYTQSGQALPEMEERLQAFEKEKEILFAPFVAAMQRNRHVTDIRSDCEEQRYLQEIYSAVHPEPLTLEKAGQVRQETDRISDISIYHSGEEKELRFFIRCKVDGEQQMAVPMTKDDAREYLDLRKDIDLQSYASRYFRGALENSRNEEQDRSLHR